MEVAVSNETELGLGDGAEVPSKTMVLLSEVKLLFVAIVSLTTMLELSEVTSAFTITVPFETVFGAFVESRVSSPDCCNQRQAEYSSHTASLPI
mmetsp:Transcript_478/g.801  ORF Transcript_478/g.801 Transcript_478/m.801 type:complete len:94 (+) Transcript_478:272-553(+)